jgi:hypothetical protein
MPETYRVSRFKNPKYCDIKIDTYTNYTNHNAMSGNINPLTPELNPSAQRCLTRFSTRNLAFRTVHFLYICVKNQQIHQLLIQLINYVW